MKSYLFSFFLQGEYACKYCQHGRPLVSFRNLYNDKPLKRIMQYLGLFLQETHFDISKAVFRI